MSEWISVEDRLPEECTDVLTHDKNGRTFMCTYRSKRFKLFFHCSDHDPVTHWMPLPEPPKVESNE